MSQVMIALVSEQRMQNIIPVFQKGAHFQRVWLVRSTDADRPGSRFAQAWRDTSEALRGSLAVESAEPSVGAYAIAATREVVARLLETGPSAAAVVNFTGGTKCMSIGAYLAAREAGVTALYVDTANEKLVWFQPDGQVREHEFDLAGRLTVPVYFRANGKQIDEERTRRKSLPANAYAAARELVGLWPQCVGTLDSLGKMVTGSQSPVATGIADDETANVLMRYGFARAGVDGWQATPQGHAFLTGQWLEAMVYVLLQDSQLFDDVQVDVCLHGVENELDVVTTRRGQLAIIECKSGDLGGQTTVNKLETIRTRLGTFARTFFVTARQANQVVRSFRNRAREYGIREIITAESLLQVADRVREGMRGVP